MTSAPYYPGLPKRMGKALSEIFALDGYSKHRAKLKLIADIQSDSESLPLDAGDDAIHQAGDASAKHIYRVADKLQTVDAILDAIRQECARRGVAFPMGEAPQEQIARAVDKNWWIKAIRKAHARRFEHVAIQLGFTNYKRGPYLSNESVRWQARRNRQNEKLLEQIKLQNENGDTYTLSEISKLGISNKTIRRGELMTRIRGFEEIAESRGDVGMFWTQTAPSKYHAVLSKGGESNPKYLAFGSPTPRDAQKYLVGVWALQRTALHNAGIHPYGFRIAEPHHDGCPHWHMLLFVDKKHAPMMEKIMRKYALAEDYGEWRTEENRVKLVRIEAGKGTAAGYIAKYVAKNIDGHGVGEHHITEDGRSFIVAPDLLGDMEITPSQRVTYWSQLHGIRQFQQIGGAPVGVWRELRRIKAETVERAPQAIKAAWKAVQKNGEEQASWAGFVTACGGVHVGRAGLVQLAKRLCTIQGRYATYETEKAHGVVYAIDARTVYESVRYTWKVLDSVRPGVAVAVPWTGVNNCTDFDYPELSNRLEKGTERAIATAKNQKIRSAYLVDWHEIAQGAREIQKASNNFSKRRNDV